MSKEIAQVLRKLEYGIYVVTMGKGTSGNALTASWLTQVSSEPPMVAMAIKSSHQSTPMLKEHGGFVVNIIGEGHDDIAKIYYGPAESGYDKLASAQVTDSPATGSPLIPGAMAWLDCEIKQIVPVGNHNLFIGEVKAAKLNADEHILTSRISNMRYSG